MSRRARIWQPAQAAKWWSDNMQCLAPSGCVAALGVALDELEALRAALAQPAATARQVPAAWRYKDSSRICDNSDGRMTTGPGWVPLYAAPRA